jgi:cytochrome c-type biogenesis protein CcmF
MFSDPGKIAVLLGLVVSIITTVLYVLANRNEKLLKHARIGLVLTSAAVFAAFGRLMYLMASHRFEYKYVFDYSSSDLAFPWNYAATWAGQHGSFLLWAFWTAVIALLVAAKSGRWEPRVMWVQTSILSFLFGVLVWLTPFDLLPRGSGPNDYPMDLPWPPAEGLGLNPSLQNYWMAIHPPTIFFGFAALAIPFAYAVAGMIWKEYKIFAERVMPWTLMAVTTLGVGLFMGGYWAYETLGWHGFWAWDPVENASLFPWLAALTLLHGLVVQKSRGGMAKTNLLMAVVGWSLFLYGTFLTRSGVLTNHSVHSFASLAAQPLMLLWVMMGVYGIGGFALLLARWKTVPTRPVSDKPLSRDTAMISAVLLMSVGTVVIAVATSWPWITTWPVLKSIPFLKSAYSANGTPVLPIFYNKIGSFLIIPALLVMGMVPFLAWGRTNPEKFLFKALVPWFIALGGGFAILWFVVAQAKSGFEADTPRALVVGIGTLGLFCAFANLALSWKLLRVKMVTMGGWLAHVGIGLLFVGTMLSNVYEKTEQFLMLDNGGVVKTSFGYAIAFEGWTHDEKRKQADAATDPAEAKRLEEEIARDWYRFDHGAKFRITKLQNTAGAARADEPAHSEDDGHDHGAEQMPQVRVSLPDSSVVSTEKNSFVAVAPTFNSRNLDVSRITGNGEGMTTQRWPYIHRQPFEDLYIVLSNDPKRLRAMAKLKPGESAPIEIPGLMRTKYMARYVDFFMEGPGGPGTTMGAVIEITNHDGQKAVVRPALKVSGGRGMEHLNAQIPEMSGAVAIEGGIDVSSKEATFVFEFPDAPPMWAIPLAVTHKPFINFVWLGVILMGIGSVVAMIRRSLEARKGVLMLAAAAAGAEAAEAPAPAPADPKPAGGKARTRKAKTPASSTGGQHAGT